MEDVQQQRAIQVGNGHPQRDPPGSRPQRGATVTSEEFLSFDGVQIGAAGSYGDPLDNLAEVPVNTSLSDNTFFAGIVGIRILIPTPGTRGEFGADGGIAWPRRRFGC